MTARQSGVSVDRFYSKVEKEPMSGCWIWTACCDRRGYGRFYFNGKPERAHRASWQIHNGKIPDGMRVLHRCDLPCCVSPHHLFLGTQADNVTDMAMKWRGRTGEMPYGVGAQLSGRFQAAISWRGEQVSLGTYDTIQEAHQVAVSEKQKRVEAWLTTTRSPP